MIKAFWEQSATISDKDCREAVTALQNSGLDELYVCASAGTVPDGFAKAGTDSVYEFAKANPGAAVLRLKEGGEPVPPQILKKMVALHQERNAPYTYTDGKDLNRSLLVEIIEAEAFAKAEAPGFYPDGSLALFKLDGAWAYVLDAEDYAYYYGSHFERFYSSPVGISIEPSSRCNLKCKMCCYQSEMYANAPMQKIPRFFDRGIHNKIIDEATSHGRPMSIEYCWRGEPMLNPELFSLLRYATDKGVPPSLVTNATLLTEENAEKLLDTGIGAVTFSIDGATKKTYETIRIGANFDTVKANVNRFIELAQQRDKRPIICIKTCRQEDNKAELDDLVAEWINKVDYVIIQNQSFPGGDTYRRWFNPESMRNLYNRRPPCHALWLNFTISTTGNAAPCVTFFDENPEDILGNVSESGVLDLWNGDDFKSRRALALEKRFDEIPLCKECDGVSCSAITLGKQFLGDDLFAVFSAGYVMYSRPSTALLYPGHQRTEA